MIRRTQEARRDVEAIMLTSQQSRADDGSSNAGLSGGLGAWLTTNTNRGAGGANGGFANSVVAAPTAGTARPISETDLRDVAELVYSQGGNPTVAMSIPKVIRKISNYMFTGNAGVASLSSEVNQSREAVVATGAVNVFVTDFGINLELVPNRVMQPEAGTAQAPTNANLYLIDPANLAISYLHGYRTEQLSKVGLADNRQISVDWTLCVKTEKAHGVIADIDPVAAMVA